MGDSSAPVRAGGGLGGSRVPGQPGQARSRRAGAVLGLGALHAARWAAGAPRGERSPRSIERQRPAGGRTCRGNELNKRRLLFKARRFEIFGQEEKRKETFASTRKKKKSELTVLQLPHPHPRAFLRAQKERPAPAPSPARVSVWNTKDVFAAPPQMLRLALGRALPPSQAEFLFSASH